jgi:general secretion pathway protein A
MRRITCRTEILEEIRLLTNLETSQQKLLQIVLAGQPELDLKLDSYDLRQLKQRIALRCHLDALSSERNQGVHEPPSANCGSAGGVRTFFPSLRLMPCSNTRAGIPRLVNTVCENALLSGYAKQERPRLASEIIDAVARDLRLGAVVIDPRNNGGLSREKEKEKNELLLAVKKLLEVHGRMQESETKGRLQ